MNDPNALCQWGMKQYNKGDDSSVFEYFTKAAELGDVEARYRLGCMYVEGRGVEKDWINGVHHFEKAAVDGHPGARHILGIHEWSLSNFDRAVKHYIISATQGLDDSIKELMKAHLRRDFWQKEDLAAALRAHQAAVDATKSQQREAADKYRFGSRPPF